MGAVIRGKRAVASVAAALALLPSVASASPPQPNSQTQPLLDGCQRSPLALFTSQSPEWAYVYNTPANQPAPPPQTLSGVVSSGNPNFQAVHTSGGDLPFGHNAYDFNINVLPDPGYQYLVSTANTIGSGEDTNRVHTEWEDTVVSKFTWPEPGDHIIETGSWIWDCGHWGTPTNIFSPDYLLPHVGQPCPGPLLADPSQCTVTGESTEFHPYRSLWVDRGLSPNSSTGATEGDVFVSTDKTLAGVEADCAHQFPPPNLGLLMPFLYGPDYRACLQTQPLWQDVSGAYSYLLPAPPKPTPSAQLVFRAVDKGSVNAPAPTLTAEGNAVRVTFDLHPPAQQRVVMAYQVFAGWSVVPAPARPTHLRITFDQLQVHRAMDPGCSRNQPVPGCQLESTRQNQLSTPPGHWNLYWDANGIWGQWGLGNGEFLASDGQIFQPSPSLRPVDLYVPPGQGWRFFVHGRECDLGGLDPQKPFADCPTDHDIADDNDVPGYVLDSYPSADASLGQHVSNGRTANADPTSTCPDGNPNGCYTLTYTVQKINDLTPADPPTASITSPVNGTTYRLGQVVKASYACLEGAGGPGLASCTAPLSNGTPIDTSTLGPHGFTVVATSLDGQSSVATAGYLVSAVAPPNSFFNGGVAGACTVPRLKGKKLKAAKKALRKAHCRLHHVKRRGHKPRRVKKQRPKPGTVLPPGSKVKLKLRHR